MAWVCSSVGPPDPSSPLPHPVLQPQALTDMPPFAGTTVPWPPPAIRPPHGEPVALLGRWDLPESPPQPGSPPQEPAPSAQQQEVECCPGRSAQVSRAPAPTHSQLPALPKNLHLCFGTRLMSESSVSFFSDILPPEWPVSCSVTASLPLKPSLPLPSSSVLLTHALSAHVSANVVLFSHT